MQINRGQFPIARVPSLMRCVCVCSWTALRLAVEHAWGGTASNEKVRVMINEVLSFFGHGVQNGGKVRFA
jgi:hypothetical protein